MLQAIKKMFGSRNDRELKRIGLIVSKINALEQSVSALDDASLAAKTPEMKQRIANGESIDSILPLAFAVCREMSKRVLGMRHFDVQLVGAIGLHEGKIAEMKTGEGKTLTATLALYANALAGKGAHLVTVNDYLARRDSEWMGKLYGALGMTTGLIVHGLSDAQRKAGYSCDITYGTNNEFGFDYLRDNMKSDRERQVQRAPFFAIVDEVDSILIDEARTPLIISGPAETNTEIYVVVNAAIPGLHKDSDYILDEKSNNVTLTEDGISKLEKRLKVQNLYDPTAIEYLHHVQQALKAHTLFKKDVDYVVRDGKVVIVDEHTGRLMPGRRYSDGLHGALEAKENLPVESENQTLATVTFQNFFRMYKKLAGMTGTADTEAVEFKKIYNLDVLVIPTNRKMLRKDHEDIIYRTAREKFTVIAEEIAARQTKGQPILVGTVSVEKSELLSSLLRRLNIPHEVLNAKNHSREAQIIAEAGQKGHVTISTNMAGRGTDIVLGEGVRELGGLCVIGTERHESRRIDNQLRGRSGRQGDAGESIFYLSLEDDLMRIFASDRLSGFMQTLGMKEGESIVSSMVSRAIERAQKRVEEQHFSSRKHLLEYDDVMNQQRQVVYSRRQQIISGNNKIDFIDDVALDVALRIAERYRPETSSNTEFDAEAFRKELQAEFGGENVDFSTLEIKDNPDASAREAAAMVLRSYEAKVEAVGGKERMQMLENYIYLQVIDQAWKDHLLSMDHLKDSVSLRGYAQKDPLQEYKKEAYRLFEEMMQRIEDETVLALLRMPTPQVSIEVPQHKEVSETQMKFVHSSPESANGLPDDSGSRQRNTSDRDEEVLRHTQSRRSAAAAQASQQQPVVREANKVGRNDPCPCGSGKKYKKCHGAQSGEAHE